MNGKGRIDSAIAALKIFMRSLPTDCMFSVCSFGSRYTWMGGSFDQACLPYTEAMKEEALALIEKFTSDHGGTKISEPLQAAQNMDSCGKKKRIFILTDGRVSEREKVVEQARQHSD